MKRGTVIQVTWAIVVVFSIVILVSLKAGFWNQAKSHPNEIPDLKLTKLPKTPIVIISWDQKKTRLYWSFRDKKGLQSVIKLQWADVPTDDDEKAVQPLLVEMAKKQLGIAKSEKVFYKPLRSEDKKEWTVAIEFTSDFPSKFGAPRPKPPTWVEFDDGTYYPSK